MNTKTCTIDGCDNPHWAKGYCNKHYTRWKRYGNASNLGPRICEFCKEEFDPPRRTSLACSKRDCVGKRKMRNNRNAAASRERQYRTTECAGCGKTFTTRSRKRKYCGAGCTGRAKVNLGPLREAVAESNYDAIIDLLRERTAETDSGCWEWQGPYEQTGYPRVGFSKAPAEGMPRIYLAHRLMLEAKLGHAIVGIQAHHTCANNGCINPDHLEPTTAAENVGEMMARKSYEARIKSLEDALKEVAPDHPLLAA